MFIKENIMIVLVCALIYQLNIFLLLEMVLCERCKFEKSSKKIYSPIPTSVKPLAAAAAAAAAVEKENVAVGLQLVIYIKI